MAREVEYPIRPGVTALAVGGGEFNSFDAFYNGRDLQAVWLWDVGPEKPVQPKRPLAPKGREGDPEFELAMVDFRAELEEYQEAMLRHKKAKQDYAYFDKRFGGPYEARFESVDARDALANDARAVEEGRQTKRRYYISSRTRGRGNLPNGGLPEGLKPGHGHMENLRREREGEEDMITLRKSDPVFGATEVHS